MADIFNKTVAPLKTPITADRATLTVGGKVIGDAIQMQISYSQSVMHRRSIGNKAVIIYQSPPRGQISIARLITGGPDDLLGSQLTSCTGGSVSFRAQSCEGTGQVNYVARGAIVESIGITANSDDFTVMDNVTISFVELSFA